MDKGLTTVTIYVSFASFILNNPQKRKSMKNQYQGGGHVS